MRAKITIKGARVKYLVFCCVILVLSLPAANSFAIVIDSDIVVFNELLQLEKHTVYSSDLVGSVTYAMHVDDLQRTKLLVKQILFDYPEYPIAWVYDGLLKFQVVDLNRIEKSSIMLLTHEALLSCPQ